MTNLIEEIMKIVWLLSLFALVIFTAITTAQTANDPDTTVLKNKLKSDFDELFGNPSSVYKFERSQPDKGHYYCSENDVSVFDDRLELKHGQENAIIYFLDIIDYPIEYTADDDPGIACNDFYIGFTAEEEQNKVLVQDILSALANFNKKRYKEINSFRPIADKYRALLEKPLISEEQRRYIVQANGFNEQRLYGKAIELYIKAIKSDQTAYPAAYSNLALLYAQLNKFDAAVYYMKKYLMLEPDAADARGAQDKIYLWEVQIVN